MSNQTQLRNISTLGFRDERKYFVIVIVHLCKQYTTRKPSSLLLVFRCLLKFFPLLRTVLSFLFENKLLTVQCSTAVSISRFLQVQV